MSPVSYFTIYLLTYLRTKSVSYFTYLLMCVTFCVYYLLPSFRLNVTSNSWSLLIKIFSFFCFYFLTTFLEVLFVDSWENLIPIRLCLCLYLYLPYTDKFSLRWFTCTITSWRWFCCLFILFFRYIIIKDQEVLGISFPKTFR